MYIFCINEGSCVFDVESPCSSFSFALAHESFNTERLDIMMGFFSFKCIKMREGNGISRGSHEGNFFVEKPIESFVFFFHVVVDLEVYMKKFSGVFFCDTTQEVADSIDIFPVHTDDEGTVRCLR